MTEDPVADLCNFVENFHRSFFVTPKEIQHTETLNRLLVLRDKARCSKAELFAAYKASGISKTEVKKMPKYSSFFGMLKDLSKQIKTARVALFLTKKWKDPEAAFAHSEYLRAYRNRPEIREKAREYRRNYQRVYRTIPSHKAKKAEYMRKYQARPEVKESTQRSKETKRMTMMMLNNAILLNDLKSAESNVAA